MTATLLAAVVACESPHGATGGASGDGSATPDLVRKASLTGCVAHGYRAGEVVLVVLGDTIESSTTADIAWQGTRQYTLVVPAELQAQARVGQRVTASGTIVDPPGRPPGRLLDQEQSAYGMPFREFRASSVQPVDGPCRRTPEFVVNIEREGTH